MRTKLTVPMLHNKTEQPQSPRTKMLSFHTLPCFQKPRLQTDKSTRQAHKAQSKQFSVRKTAKNKKDGRTAHASASHPAQ